MTWEKHEVVMLNRCLILKSIERTRGRPEFRLEDEKGKMLFSCNETARLFSSTSHIRSSSVGDFIYEYEATDRHLSWSLLMDNGVVYKTCMTDLKLAFLRGCRFLLKKEQDEAEIVKALVDTIVTTSIASRQDLFGLLKEFENDTQNSIL